jgi:PKD repeat protein
MKKSILFVALGIILLSGHSFATGVTTLRAQAIALNFYKIQNPAAASSPLTATLVYTQTEADGTNDYYIYNMSPAKGFVIVAGDDNATPVIAYSSESSFLPGDMSKIGLSDWMKSSAVKIHYVVTNHVQADATISTLWTSYAQGINPQTSRSGSIGPLCTTTWNQSPYYNSLCPPAALPSTSGSKAVTGCVATAMAQIMKYWNYPAKGTGGVISYATGAGGYGVNYGTLSANMDRALIWSAMPNSVSSETSPVDTLMYELGVAVNMSYDSTGSGAFVLSSETGGGPCSQTVYANNFYYNKNTLQGVQYASYTTDAWIALLENEINAGRVVQYEGSDPAAGGHTWVMDGYQAHTGGDYLHMNWGWGGAYNGWYAVTNLATPGFDPSTQDAALIGIEPLQPFSIALSATSPSICPAGSTTLTASGPASATYTWTPATGLSDPTIANPVASPAATTLYTVTVDSAGVTGSMSVAVSVIQPVTGGFSFSAAASCSLPESVAFVNSSSNATSYTWDFGDGSAAGTAASPVHSYSADGTYTVKLISANQCGADTVTQNQAVTITGGTPTAASRDICTGQSVTLTAAGTNLTWYSDAQGQNAMQYGDTFVTPSLSSTITYYVGSSANPSVVTAGPLSDAIGGNNEYSNNTFRGLTFDNNVVQTLNSVVVYATGAGPRTFAVEDSSGNVIDSATFTLINGPQTVQLGFNLPVGIGMVLGVLGTPNLIRNTDGAVFPYTSTDGSLSITGNNAGSAGAGRYYFCYDWQLQQAPCTTPLTPVTVFVLGTGGYFFTATGTGGPTVSFSPGDTSSSDTYTWSFGDGSPVSTQASPTHTYATGGIYTVKLTVSNGSCSDSATQLVNTLSLGINDINTLSSATVYPNPARDMITLSVNSTSNVDGCHLAISNILGQNVYGKDVDLTGGNDRFDINVSGLSSGVYIISVQNGKNMVTSKFVKD